MRERLEIHYRSIGVRKASVRRWQIPEVERRFVLRFIEELGLGKVNRGHRLSESRQCKYLDVLRCPLEFFGKPIPSLTARGLEAFENAITSGKLQSSRHGPYA